MSREELKSEIETIICDFKSYDESIDETSEKIMQLFRKYEKEREEQTEPFKAAWRLKGEDLYVKMKKVEPQKIDYQPEKSSLGDKLFGFI